MPSSINLMRSQVLYRAAQVGAVRSNGATARARGQLKRQGKPTGDALAHGNLLQQSYRAHIPWVPRKLSLQL